MVSAETEPNNNLLTQPEVIGYQPDIAQVSLQLIRLPENPPFLEVTNPTLVALRQATSQDVDIAVLANEADFTNALNSIAATLTDQVKPDEKNFFVNIQQGGFRLQSEIHNRLPDLVPPPASFFPSNTLPTNTDIIQVTRTNEDASLSNEGAQIIHGFDNYDVNDAHVIIFEDLLDSNQSLQAVIDNAVENGAKQITIVALFNKLNLPDAPTQEQKTILSTSSNIPLKIIVPFAIEGNRWVGGWGCDYMLDIGRDDDFLGVKIDPPSLPNS